MSRSLPIRPLPADFDAAAFWARSVVEPTTGCWLWSGYRDWFGHGSLSAGGRRRGAHRVAFELASGPIPEGLFVCHHCDVPACINPEHLYAGTHRDNMRDRNVRGRAASGDRNASRLYPGIRRGSRNGGSRLTESVVATIKQRLCAGETLRALAAEYDVAVSTIGMISNGTNWAHVHGLAHEAAAR